MDEEEQALLKSVTLRGFLSFAPDAEPIALTPLNLMIECMESWFLADPEALADFYGQGFRASALPASAHVEPISKRAVYAALEKATRETRLGPYGKGEHSFKLLALLDPAKVRSASPAAEALLTHPREAL